MNWYRRYILANSNYYGAWISPTGEEFYVKEDSGHGKLGKKILKERHGIEDSHNPWIEMLNLGYVRVVYMQLGINAEVKLTNAQKLKLSQIIRSSESPQISFDAPVARSYDTVTDVYSALAILRRM